MVCCSGSTRVRTLAAKPMASQKHKARRHGEGRTVGRPNADAMEAAMPQPRVWFWRAGSVSDRRKHAGVLRSLTLPARLELRFTTVLRARQASHAPDAPRDCIRPGRRDRAVHSPTVFRLASSLAQPVSATVG